jgi:hypothetical protein
MDGKSCFTEVVKVTATILFVGAIVCGLAVRLWLATLGGNFDLNSWVFIARGMDNGYAIYTSAGHYNYGPVWAWILHGLAHLTPILFGGATSVLRFHVVIAGFLGLVDAAIAWIVSRIYGTTAAVIFVLCPIGVLTSGFHSQFDNLAVLLGLLAWVILRDPALRKQPGAFWAAAVFVGLSLATKHILIFLPIWILLWAECGALQRRLGFCAVAYGIFAAGFLPWLLDPASRPYVIANVFEYTSVPQYSFLRRMAAHFAPWLLSAHLPIPGLTVVNLVWAAAMFLLGAIAIRVQARNGRPEIYMIYLTALVPFAPSAAIQYLAIPLLAAAVAWRNPAAWVFMVAGSIIIFFGDGNVGGLPAVHGLALTQFASRLRYHGVLFTIIVFLVTELCGIARGRNPAGSADVRPSGTPA